MSSTAKKDLPTQLLDLPLDAFVRDENNRDVASEAAANGEEWEEFVDSIRVHGVIHPALAVDLGDGRYQLHSGERRWLGSRAAGRPTLATRVYPKGTRRQDLVELGLIANVHVKPLGCLDVASRLRELKSQHAYTHEQLADRLGLKADKVKHYLGLTSVSDRVYAFIEQRSLPLRVALELARFDKKLGELETRRLLKTFDQEAPTVAAIAAERSKLEKERRTEEPGAEAKPATARASGLSARITKAFAKDKATALAELETALGAIGYRLVPAAQVQ